MIVKKLDEYKEEWYNNSETTIGVYEFPGTKNEKHITMKPKDKIIIKIKERIVKEVKSEDKRIPPINTKKGN